MSNQTNSNSINAAEIQKRFTNFGVEADRIKAAKDALRAALTALEFKDIRETRNGCITTEDVEGLATRQISRDIFNVSDACVIVDLVQRNHGRIRYDGIIHAGPVINLPANWSAKTEQAVEQDDISNELRRRITELADNGNEAAVEVMQYIAAKEQKKRTKAVIHIGGSDAGEVIPYTKKDLGYFFWTLLDDLYLAKGIDFIKEVIGDGGRNPSKKELKVLSERFKHAFSFETYDHK